ncbi:Rha family transcriptional regulator [Aureimonas ureilytica]|uniref:Rha family transcriptional regulator n=1 Tax=Aureimonas ureilytica TaxID=401562 RepID=UPI0009DC0786|nr:Rha family transcriptional regulator [Aureimonas ureilytica]
MPATMSSREIADLTGKRHDHVIRDIRNMLDKLGEEGGSPDRGKPSDLHEYHRHDRTQYKFLTPGTIDAFMGFMEGKSKAYPFEGEYVDPQNGQTYPCFNLPRRECLILVSGYNIILRAKIIDRWEELEREVAEHPSAVPRSLSEALRMAADLAEENESLRAEVHKLEQAVPNLDDPRHLQRLLLQHLNRAHQLPLLPNGVQPNKSAHDIVLRIIRREGELTRSQLTRKLHGALRPEETDRAIQILADIGQIEVTEERPRSGGAVLRRYRWKRRAQEQMRLRGT